MHEAGLLPQPEHEIMVLSHLHGFIKAADLDKLAEAASLIQTVADEGQRKELSELYDRRGAELNPA